MPWRGFALSWERSSLSLCLSSFMFTVAPVAFMQRVSNYPSSKMEVSLQKIRYLGKAIGTEYNSPYKDSEPFWNFFPPTPRRKAFFVCCYGCPFKRFIPWWIDLAIACQPLLALEHSFTTFSSHILTTAGLWHRASSWRSRIGVVQNQISSEHSSLPSPGNGDSCCLPCGALLWVLSSLDLTSPKGRCR